jgi:hypothetical protein
MAHTVPQFRMLCQTERELAKTEAIIDRDGRTYFKAWVDSSGQEHEELKAHPLLAHYRSLLKQSQNLLEKFMLGPFGKPVSTPIQTTAQSRQESARQEFFGTHRGSGGV